MPIYEYQCEKCGHVFEHFTFCGSGEEERACPKCGQAGAKKMISSFSSSFGSEREGEGGCGSSRGFS